MNFILGMKKANPKTDFSISVFVPTNNIIRVENVLS